MTISWLFRALTAVAMAVGLLAGAERMLIESGIPVDREAYMVALVTP